MSIAKINIPLTEVKFTKEYPYTINGTNYTVNYNFFGDKSLNLQYKDLTNTESSVKKIKYFSDFNETEMIDYDEWLEFDSTEDEFNNFKFNIAPIKYNKDKVLCISFDGGDMGGYNNSFCEIHGLKVGNSNYNELIDSTIITNTGINFYMTDGCNNKIYPSTSFAVPESLIINDGNGLQKWQMKRMFNFGNDISLYRFDTSVPSDSQTILESVSPYFNTVIDKYKTTLGKSPIGLIIPGTTASYKHSWYINNSSIMIGKVGGETLINLNDVDICKLPYDRKFCTSTTTLNDIKQYFNLLINSDKTTPLALFIGLETNYDTLKLFYNYLLTTEGAIGSDTLLMCSAEELYEYLYFKRSVRLYKTYVNGKTRLNLKGKLPINFTRKELTILTNINSNNHTYSNGIYTFSTSYKNGVKQINLSISDFKVDRLTETINLINTTTVDYTHDRDYFYLSLTPEKRNLFPNLSGLYQQPQILSCTITSNIGLDIEFSINSIGTNLTYMRINGSEVVYENNKIYTYSFNSFGDNTLELVAIGALGESQTFIKTVTSVRPNIPVLNNIEFINKVDNNVTYNIDFSGFTTTYQIYEAPLNTQNPELITPIFNNSNNIPIQRTIVHKFLNYGNNTLFIRLNNGYDYSNYLFNQILTEASPIPTINNVSTTTIGSENVIFNIDVNYASQMAFSLTSNQNNISWIDYNTNYTLTIPKINGTYIIYYYFKNNSGVVTGNITYVLKLPLPKLLINLNGKIITSYWDVNYNCTNTSLNNTKQSLYYVDKIIGSISCSKGMTSADDNSLGYTTGNNSGVFPDTIIQNNVISTNTAGGDIITIYIQFTDASFINKLCNVRVLTSTINTGAPEPSTVTYSIGNAKVTPTKIVNNYLETLNFYSIDSSKLTITYQHTGGYLIVPFNAIEIEFIDDLPILQANTLTIANEPLLINGKTIIL